MKMDSVNRKLLAHDFFPFFKVFKDGRIERYATITKVPSSTDPISGVISKDVVVSPDPFILARLYVPPMPDPNKKLPLVVYYHGGCFCVGSAFAQNYHDYLNYIVGRANVVAVSVEYRLGPEEPMNVCFDDSWVALRWVAMHVHGNGPETWLNNYVNFKRTFFMGDSAGGTIAYRMAVLVGSSGLPGMKLVGLVLVHPYFVGVDRFDRICLYMMGRSHHGGLEDPRLKPVPEDVAKIRCEKVLVFVGAKDDLREIGLCLCDELKKSMRGTVEIVEHQGGHVFHLVKPLSENAINLKEKVVSFLIQDESKFSSKM